MFSKPIFTAKNIPHVTFEVSLQNVCANDVSTWYSEHTVINTSHISGCVSMSVQMHFQKCHFEQKHNPHESSLKGFSPVSIRKYVFKLQFSEKHNPHKSHCEGFLSSMSVQMGFQMSILRKA